MFLAQVPDFLVSTVALFESLSLPCGSVCPGTCPSAVIFAASVVLSLGLPAPWTLTRRISPTPETLTVKVISVGQTYGGEIPMNDTARRTKNRPGTRQRK